MTFFVGQKVVCIRKGPWTGGYEDEIDPIAGHVYTIRAIVPYPDGNPGLLLVEIVNAPRYYEEGLHECDYQAENFRPVVEDRKTVSFTEGAPKDSEKWDNRKDVSAPQRVRINT